MSIEFGGRARSRSKSEEIRIDEPREEESLRKEKASLLSRRSILKTGATVALMGAGKYIKHAKDGSPRNRPHEHAGLAETEQTEKDQELLAVLEECKTETIDTGEVADLSFVGLERLYLGNPKFEKAAEHRVPSRRALFSPSHHHHEANVLGPRIEVNAPRNLYGLWQRKIALSENANGEPNARIAGIGYDRVLDYADRFAHPEKHVSILSNVAGHSLEQKRAESLGRTTLAQAKIDVEARMAPIRDAFQTEQVRNALEAVYALHNQETKLATLDLIQRVSALMVLSYSVTELMYGSGKKTVAKYNFLMGVLGKQFLASIPSLGDRIASLGEDQMTDMGFRDTSPNKDVWLDVNIQRNAASKPNSILPDELMLPKHLEDLKTYEDHAVAAYLYSIDVIASAVRGIPQPQLKLLKDTSVMTDTTLMSFIATSNNNPAAARQALHSWLNAKSQGREISLEECCNAKILVYAKKSVHNYDAIDDESNAVAEVEGRERIAPRSDEALNAALVKMPKRKG